MSDKEWALSTIRNLPESASRRQIIRELLTADQSITNAESPALREEWTANGLSEEEWRAWIAHTLEPELSDARQDIYTMDDGEPINGVR